jgi:hypothetical protein
VRLLPFALIVLACAGQRHAVAPPRSRPPATLSGTWVWRQRAVHPVTGDLHVQEETWELEQAGTDVRGHYDRAVTAISGDGRPYRCNEELSFTRRTRYQVRGTVRNGRIELEEVDYTAEAGPCDDGVRDLDRYVGDVDAETIVLSWGTGRQVLRRPAAQPAAEARADLTGEWVWEHRAVGLDGERRVEQERWVLEQHGGELRGHYESTVTLTSGDDRPFRCSRAVEYTTHASFDVVGRVEDDNRVLLRETAVKVQPGPCDPGQRRLASYTGSAVPGALTLDWGGGRQTLRRR